MEKRRAGRQYPAGLVAVTAIDLVIYGLVLGVAFASGEQTGLLLSIALACEVPFLSLSVGAALAVAGTGGARVLATPVGLALLFFHIGRGGARLLRRARALPMHRFAHRASVAA